MEQALIGASFKLRNFNKEGYKMITDQDIITLARTIYGEARGEYTHPSGGLAALIGVANVVMNRTKAGGRFGDGVHNVCTRPYQFSCWNASDPNRSLISRLEKGSNLLFDICYLTASEVARGSWPDLTKSSDHYHAPMERLPAWAIGKKPVVTLGRHHFYKLIP